MATALRGLDDWLSATFQVLLAVVGIAVVLYPIASLGNTLLGSPVSPATVNLIVGVLALGAAYPVVAGDWSLGRLGEYVFALVVSAVCWGVVGMVLVVVSGIHLSGSDPVPQAALWTAAYLSAYVLVYRFRLPIFR